jgi:iron complex outermembrane recepter protein
MLHLKNYITILITLGYISLNIYGQCNHTISGKVIDKHHAEGLEYATLYLEEANVGTEADEQGNYQFSKLCSGRYHLIISHIGCQTERRYLELLRDTSIDIQLEHHSFMLEDVAIIGINSRYGISSNQYKITGELLQSYQGKDMGQIVSATPGVNLLRSGYTINKPMINGLTGSRIILANQGIPLESQQWGNDHAPEIDPFTAQTITVIKGSAAVKYGINAMGGIIITESLPIQNDPHPHFGITSMYHTNGKKWVENITVEGSSKLLKYRMIGTFKKSGDLSTPTYLLTNTGSQEYNFATLFTNDNNSKWYRSLYASTFNTTLGILRGAHITNTTDLKEAISRKIPFNTSDTFTYHISAPSQEVNHHMLKFENRFKLTENRTINIDLAMQQNIRREFDIRRGNQSNRPILHLNLRNIWADAAYTALSENTKIQWGLQNKYTYNQNVSGTGVTPILPNYVQNNLSTYGHINHTIQKISIEGSSRFEYQYLNSFIGQKGGGNGYNLANSIGLNYNQGHIFTSKLNVGYINRLPFVNELYSNGLHQGLAAIEEGNPTLTREKSWKYIWENKWNISESINLSAVAFYHKFSNYIYLVPFSELRLTVRGAYPVFQYRQEDASLLGTDIMINMEVSHNVELIGKYSHIRGSNSRSMPLVFIPPKSGDLRLNYLLRKIGSLKDVKLSGEIQHVAKQNRLVTGQDYTDSPAAYTLLNLSLASVTKLFEKEVKVQAGVDNLFNTTYRNYLNRFRYFADELGRNINFKINVNI